MVLRKLKTQVRNAVLPRRAPTPGKMPNGLPYPTVDLVVWRPQDGSVNFGDFLSRVVVDLTLARRGYTLGDEVDQRRQMLAIGSVLHLAKDGAAVWGSGINGKMPAEAHTFSTLDVRAVRGPRTAEFLRSRGITVPDVFGDPALLLPVLAPERFRRSQRGGVALVPNLNDSEAIAEIAKDMRADSVTLVSPRAGWNRCVEAIIGHDLVLASSLHGLIIAEAFGVPARYVRLTETENLFKYTDYYEGTGRPDFRYARSIAEGREMGGERPPVFDPEPLLKAFPFDLWEPKRTTGRD
jgi:pyruvyltransferase